MNNPLNFAILGKFLAFAKGASEKDGLNRNAFKHADDSFLSLLMEEHEDASRALRTISTLRSTLTELSRLVEEGLSSAREELLPGIYGRGVYSLPFEVVAHIFELLHDDGEWRNLLSTNRSFRNIALNISKLWTTVSSQRNPQISLERSGSRGMIITVPDISLPDAHTERFFRLLQPHPEKWKLLSVRKGYHQSLDDLDSRASLVLQHLRDDNEGKTFPALETLQVGYGDDVPLDMEEADIVLNNEEDPNASIRSFFGSWDMPALRCVDVVGFIPMLPSACQGNLTCFRLKLAGGCLESMFIYDLQAIARFLRSLPALKELSIELCMIDDFSTIEGFPVEMSLLKTLNFRVTTSIETTLPLLDMLSTPNLQELTLTIDAATHDDATDFLDAFFPINKPRWPHLETLSCHIEISEAENENNVVPLNSLCSRLPRLHHLTIETWILGQPAGLMMHSDYEELDWHQQPPLQTLRLVNCEMFETSFIFGLREIVNASDFKILEIRNGPKINTEVVRRLMPEGKIFICTEHDWTRKINMFKYKMPEKPARGSLERMELFYA